MRLVAVDTSERDWMEWAVVDLAGGAAVAGAVGPARDLEARVPEVLAEGLALGAGALVVTTGPGSLTGIRIGVAAAMGAGMARGLPVHGVGSLEVAAFAVAGGEVVAVRPAGRGGLWVGRYQHRPGGLDELEPPRRVEEAVWQPPAGAVVGRISMVPAPGTGAGRPRPLVAAARCALGRPPLDLALLDPATGRALQGGL